MEEIVSKPCVVCGDPVDVQRTLPDDEVLCIVHFFTGDPTEDWESDGDD